MPLQRLSVEEYRQSVRAVVGAEALAAIGSDPFLTIPPDSAQEEGEFSRGDQRLSSGHVDGFFAVADSLAAAIAGDTTLRASVAGECARGTPDEACLRAFAERMVERAYRRPAELAEVDSLLASARDVGGGAAGVHAIVFVTLMAPEFLYRFENAGAEEGDAVRLTAHELATRLSYHFWGAPPDAELLAAAAAGTLDDDAGYRAQVDRLADDPRAAASLDAFFTEWMHLSRGSFTAGPRLELARGALDVSGLGAEMEQEVLDLLRYQIETGGTWDDVLTTRASFARSDRLAALYGVAPWDGSSEPPLLPEAERSGLLTRAGMLRTGDGSTNPFRRGIFVRRAILCDSVAPPPADLPSDALTPPPPTRDTSTRESFVAKVVDEPCASCHRQFAPLGYALEDFDGLGRFRSVEQVIGDDGTALGSAPVDALADAQVEYGDDAPLRGGVELSARIADTPKADGCFATHYLRFTYRRHETRADSCAIGEMAASLGEGASLAEVMRAVALDPTFRRRLLEE